MPIAHALRHLKDSQLNTYLNNKPTLLQVIFRAKYHQTNNFFSSTMFFISNKQCKFLQAEA